MLRLSKLVLAGLAAGALFSGGVAFAQADLGSRLDAADKKLSSVGFGCKKIDASEYEALLAEATDNLKRGTKAQKAGAPVDVAKLNADLERAKRLRDAAIIAAARCQATSEQPKSQLPGPGSKPATPNPTPAGVPNGGQSCTPAPAVEPADFSTPRIPTEEEIRHIGDLMETAAENGRAGEADFNLRSLDEMATRLQRAIDDAKQAGEFSKINVKEAEKRLKQINDWRKGGERHRLPCSPFAPQTPKQTSLNPFDQRVLDAQNAERAMVGAPALKWNDQLAQHATEYAQVLARTGDLVHAPREGRGTERENLQKGLIGWSPERMIQDWAKEKNNFTPGNFPDVARDGNWLNVAHYTQMIWPTTTDVGCGMALGGGFNWFVCRYNPGGNKDGKPVGQPVQVAQQMPAIDLREAAANSGGRRGAWYVGGDFGAMIMEDVPFDYGLHVTTPAPTALSFMINGVLDFGDDDGISGFVGGGVGVARIDYNNVRAFSNQGAVIDDSDTRFAWQVIAGLRAAQASCPAPAFAGGVRWDPVYQVTIGGGPLFIDLPDQLPDVETKVEQPNLGGLPELYDPSAMPKSDISDCVM